MKKILKYALIAAISISLSNCANGDDYGTPNLDADCVSLTTTATINDLNNNTVAEQFYNIDTDEIIEGYVVSSDEGGNFYKTVSIVSTDNTTGLAIALDAYNLYNRFEPGRKVYINLNGLDYQRATSYTNGLNIGKVYQANNGPRIGRIDNVFIDDAVKVSCDKVNEDQLVKHLTLDQAKNDQYLNQLIEIDAVQFTNRSLGHTYFDIALKAYAEATAIDHIITDTNGSTLIVRVSEFANFAHLDVPSGNGKIRGVMTKYGSTYQFMIRTAADVKFDGVRDNTTIENFESFMQDNSVFPNYLNIKVVGKNDWYVKTFGGNKYIQARKVAAANETIAYFAMPYDFNLFTKLSFQSLYGYMVGVTRQPLKVYYSTNFDQNNIAGSTLVDITNSFALSDYTGSDWGTFVNSGTHTFTGVSGQGHVIFAYQADANNLRPAVQVDNIKFE